MNSLDKKCEKWFRNKAELHFTGRVVFDNKSMSVLIENAPRKYLKAIRNLAGEILKDGIAEIGEAFAYSVAPEDADAEQHRVRVFLESRKDEMLNLLLEKGCKEFRKIVQEDAYAMKTIYDISTLKFTESGWRRWDNAELKPGGCFIEKKEEKQSFIQPIA